MDELREEIRKALLNKADQRDNEAQRYGDNVHLSENLKGKGDGLREAYYIVDKLIKDYSEK